MEIDCMQQAQDYRELILIDKKILIVEDDEVSAQYLMELLEDTQAELIHVFNGSDAISLINEKIQFDLILMDIQLPDMNGWQVTKIVKKINKNIPIIVQSAYAMETFRSKSEEAGCDYFISKPVDSLLLFKYIKKSLK